MLLLGDPEPRWSEPERRARVRARGKEQAGSSSPPMLLDLAAHCRCCRVLHLAPFVRAAVDIARSAALAHDALAPEQASVRVHDVTRLVEGAVTHKTGAAPGEQRGQLALAQLDRLRSQVAPLKLQQVKRAQRRGMVMPATAQQ